jgi:DNA-binding beta-propeller fold protein YncE
MEGQMNRRALAMATTAAAVIIAAIIPDAQIGTRVYRSPVNVAFSPSGDLLAATDHTAGNVAFVRPGDGVVLRRAAVSSPWGVCWQGRRAFATEYMTGTVAEMDPATGKVVRRLPVGAYPRELVSVPKAGALLVGNTGTRDVSIVDVATWSEKGRLACSGEPSAIAATPDGKVAIVGNLIPNGDAIAETNSARVGIYDIASKRRLTQIALSPGSSALRGAQVTSDGRWCVIAHALGRFNLPTTQLDRGWVNTNALSILDLAARKLYATVLLDQTQEGAADPWGLALSPDGTRAWVTLSGAQQIVCLDWKGMMRLIAGGLPDDSPLNKQSAEWAATMKNVWQEIKADPTKRSELVNDLAALYIADLIERVPLPGNGARGLALSPDGTTLAVAQYFTGDLALTDRTGKTKKVVSLGPSAKPDNVRTGERMFHDGQLCFQHWLSCATCHPDARVDGLNWDLLNDGMGNPKNTRSLLLAHRRGAMMSHGVRSNLTVATRAGFRFILFREPSTAEVTATEAYISSLKPLPSPRLLRGPDGRFAGLSPKARAGKAIFESAATRCVRCHSGPLLTDKKLHDTGTRGPFDSDSKFITPTLLEVWRTAPYLHDGRAVTMTDVLTKFNRANKHGVTKHLSKKQVDELAEYLLSL